MSPVDYGTGVIQLRKPQLHANYIYENLKNILHEAYLPLARNSSSGKIQITSFDNANLNNFSHIAEIVTEKDGKMYMLHTDKQVQDVRIVYTDKSASYTAFAAYSLVGGNGIMLQGNDETLKQMKISYKSGNETVTIPVIG